MLLSKKVHAVCKNLPFLPFKYIEADEFSKAGD